MRTNTPKSLFSFSKIYCSIVGHDYRESKKITHHIKEYTCCHCGKEATTNVRGRIEHMTPKLKEINDALFQVHSKKLARINKNPDLRVA